MLWACAVPVLLEFETCETVKHRRAVDVRAANHGKVRARRHLQFLGLSVFIRPHAYRKVIFPTASDAARKNPEDAGCQSICSGPGGRAAGGF